MKFSLYITVLVAFLFASCKKKTDPDLTKAFIKYYGGIESDQAVDMEITADGGYILLGTTRTEGAGGSDMLVIKTDNAGNEEWRKTFGGPNDDYAGGIEVITGGAGYVLCGTRSFKANVFDPRNDDTELEAIRIDNSGAVVWDSTFDYFGSFSPIYIQIGTQGIDVQNTKDGGFIFLGTVDSAKIYDTYALKLNANGNRTDSDYKFGVAGKDDVPGRIAVNSANEFVYSSSTSKVNYTPVFALFKAAAGQLSSIIASRDNKSYGNAYLALANGLLCVNGDDIISVGTTYSDTSGALVSPDNIYFVKMDKTLNKQSIITYGGSGTIEEGAAIFNTSDGGYVILGTTNNESLIGAPEKKKDLYIIKVDANGGEQWHKTYGGIGDDKAIAIKQTSDGGYAVCATIDFGNNNDNSGKSNIITLLKLDENGDLNNE